VNGELGFILLLEFRLLAQLKAVKNDNLTEIKYKTIKWFDKYHGLYYNNTIVKYR